MGGRGREGGEGGQALLEFLVFVPLFLLLVLSVQAVGHAINASINQEKVTRGYFFFLVSHDSFWPDGGALAEFPSLDLMSLDQVGWRERSGGGNGRESFAGCFPQPTVFGGGNPGDRDCDDKPRPDDPRGLGMVRVYTSFGLCTATHQRDQGGVAWHWRQKFPWGGGDEASYACAKLAQ